MLAAASLLLPRGTPGWLPGTFHRQTAPHSDVGRDPMFMMRFGMRSNAADPAPRADMYAAAIEMAAWAETKGCIAAVLSEHHASDDGYLPSPVPLAAAIAARPSTMPINVAALLLSVY